MGLSSDWRLNELGGGLVAQASDEIRLTLPAGPASAYHDAQISDYSAAAREFVNEPPLRLELRARARAEISGTAGFGFWNHAFVPGERRFRLPQALWFFFGGRSTDIALAQGLSGNGWKAATFNAKNWRFCALLPFAPLGFLLMRSGPLYDAFWSLGQAAIGVSETALDPSLLEEFHTYSIEWRRDGAIFAVDGAEVLRARQVPQSRLGFIAWIDNQYAIVKPQGRFGHGLLDIPHEQSLHLRDISITRLY
ncbi:MAG: family 16 glycosylhydrolase [Chloroflexi bacterium]|nr:family 16 glycosylhydrolase [Chloroflexota bacterium]